MPPISTENKKNIEKLLKKKVLKIKELDLIIDQLKSENDKLNDNNAELKKKNDESAWKNGDEHGKVTQVVMMWRLTITTIF